MQAQWLTEDFWKEADVAKVEACIAAGSKLDTRDERGKTPLHLAAWLNKNPDTIDTLIRHGSKVNARNENGKPPLHWAAEHNENLDIIDALLDGGADATLKDGDGKTAFDLIDEDSPLHGTDAYWRLNDARLE